MESAKISDSVVAGMMASAVDRETIVSLWSSFITPQNTSDDTLKDIRAPGYAPPEILPKTVVFPGNNMEDADYTVLAQLGEGGMGVVFEARQNHLDRTVALKMIRPGRAGDPFARASFFHEAVITAGLEHPGIVPVLEFGRDQGGRDFYVMKKATGVPWGRVIREKTIEENLAIFDRVVDVVAYAHSRGILHRDLKPANILLGDFGEVWVGDWGVAIARGPDGSFRHAHPGGTPQYMPPEMARGDAGSLGPRSDVYLLGAILLEIVTGKPPHCADTALGAILAAAANAITTNGDHPLTKVIWKALTDSPADRYASIAELRDAIDKCLAMDTCRSHMVTAEQLYKKAARDGDYALFQKAVAEYDSALATSPENSQAKRGRFQALATYSHKALANGEYDLALTIIEPETANSAKATALAQAIVQERERVARKKRWLRVVRVVFYAAILLGLGGTFYVVKRGGLPFLYPTPNISPEQAHNDRINHLYYSIRNELRPLMISLMEAGAKDAGRRRSGILEKYDEMTGILTRCDEELRVPVQEDFARKEAGIRYALEQLPRLSEVLMEIKAIDDTLSGQRQSPVPELERRFIRFAEFVKAYRRKET